jgi:single-strand DNA-binding protein
VYEVEVDDVGPSMRNASAKVTKSNRSGGAGFGSGSGSGSGSGGGSGRPAEDPWAADSSGLADTSDEPPF